MNLHSFFREHTTRPASGQGMTQKFGPVRRGVVTQEA